MKRLMILLLWLLLFSFGHNAHAAKPNDLQGFYADASALLVEFLKSGETLGSSGADSTERDLHYNWARQQSTEKLRLALLEKSDRMVMLRLEESTKAMGDFYGKVCVIWAGYGVDFGSEAANSTDYAMHANWAQNQSADRIKNGLKVRIEKMFASYIETEQSLLNASGKVTMLRVHDLGTGYGPDTDFLDVEVVISLDSQPNNALGFQLRNDNFLPARQGMLNLLRDAFNNNWTVNTDFYIGQGKKNGRIIRVWLTK